MITYHVFGFDLASAISLPELLPVKSAVRPDVSIRLGQVEEIQANVDGTDHYAGHASTIFSYRGVARFLVRNGNEIVVEPAAHADQTLMRVCLLGPVLAALVHQRGLLVLHASAVSIGDRASVFLGGKTWGKSTLAACLASRGNDVVADDVVAVDTSGRPRVFPGVPQLKLWPTAAEALGLDPHRLPRSQPGLEKRAYRIHERFARDAVELERVYVLDVGDRLQIDSLDRREAFTELVSHSYFVKFLAGFGTSIIHFKQCTELVKAVPVFRIIRPRTLTQLNKTAELLEAHSSQ